MWADFRDRRTKWHGARHLSTRGAGGGAGRPVKQCLATCVYTTNPWSTLKGNQKELVCTIMIEMCSRRQVELPNPLLEGQDEQLQRRSDAGG